MGSRILLIDIETSPILGYTWKMWDTSIIERVKGFTILSVAYQWLGEKTEIFACDTMSEKKLLKNLRKLLNKADVVVAHNGDSFDIKKINARMIIYRIKPYRKFFSVDTKKCANKLAAFDSASLNNIAIDLGEGEKIKHRGFDMWLGCMADIKQDWKDMRRYNIGDVDLLARIYKRLLPWLILIMTGPKRRLLGIED